MKRDRSEYEEYLMNNPESNLAASPDYEPTRIHSGYWARDYIRAKVDHDYEKYTHGELAAQGNVYSKELIRKAAARELGYKRVVTQQYQAWYQKRKGRDKFPWTGKRDTTVKGASKIILKKFANRWLAPKRRMARLAAMRRMSYAKMPVPGLPGHKRLYNKDIPGIIEQYYMPRKTVKGWGIRRKK